MAKKKQNLSPTSIEGLKAGRLGDHLSPGLSIERLGSGRLVWQYERRIPARNLALEVNERAGQRVKLAGGSYPAMTIAAARQWAIMINAQVENGIDPREAEREAKAQAEAADARDAITVDFAHKEYMKAVKRNEHKVTRTKRDRPIAQRTIDDKQGTYDRLIAKVMGHRPLHSITNRDLNAIIIDMSVHAPIQANRTGAELRVFWKWARGLRGRTLLGIDLDNDPTSDLGELWNAEGERTRWLDHDELPVFLQAVAEEPERHHRRALLLLLLTGCRKMELLACPSSDLRGNMLIITADRTKNGKEHPIVLGPWGTHLATTNEPWIIASPKLEDGPMVCGWPKVIERVRRTMEKLSGKPVEHFVPHDLRRTMRSHVDELVDSTITEKMLNHSLTGLEKRYNRNMRAESMAEGFALWEARVAAMAEKAGVAEALEVVTAPVVTKAAAPQSTPQPPLS